MTLFAWIAERFAARPEGQRRQLHLLGLAMALYLLHATFSSPWQIEDAAISYAFARNAAAGDGFVANPGGTWVQGYSNPSWTFFLTVCAWLGLPLFAVGKLAGIAAGVLTLPLAWLWARRFALEPDARLWPALAPLTLAFSGPAVLWSASGLENGFFSLFLGLSVVLLLREGDRPAAPWSALALAALALTRPEAPVYAATIAFFLGPRALLRGGWRWGTGFLLGTIGPVVLYYAWAYHVFGWALPNTYYAKDPAERARLMRWGHRTWTYLRGWALQSLHVFALPFFVVAQTGTRGWRFGVALGVLLGGLLVTVPGMEIVRELFAEPGWLHQFRIVVYVMGAAAVVVASLGRRRATERTMALLLVLCTLAFSVLSGGDWMRGYRWFSLASLPLSVLTAEWAGRVVPVLHRRFRRSKWAPMLFLVPLWLAGIWITIDTLRRADTTPFQVHRRVLYHQGLMERLHLDRISHMEIDMGGNLFWSGFELYDIAGLVDVPIAHHHYATRFIDQYVGQEIRPDFVHIHGGWERKSKVVHRPWFRSGWVAVPGYAHSARVWHQGTYVRKDLFVERDPAPGVRTARFGGVALHDLRIVAPEVHAGGELSVEIGWSIVHQSGPFRALLAIVGQGRTVVADLPPAYDWIPMKDWRVRRVYWGRHSIGLPDDLPEGRYAVALVVVGEDGAVVAAAEAVPDPRYAAGEIRWEDAVRVVSPEVARARAREGLERAETHAAVSACEAAEEAWSAARRHLARKDPWQEPARARIERALAVCWARKALAEPDVETYSEPRPSARWIRRARRLDHRAPEVVDASTVLADRWQAEGDAAQARGDDEGAWRGWRDALVADPGRSALRRKFEALRAVRLELPR